MTPGETGEPVLTSDGSKTLYSEKFQQTYHSIFGASTEAQHVFLNTSGAQSRLAAGQPTRIFEVGLGPGLNFLLTADFAARHKTPLDYTAVEHSAPSRVQIDDLGYQSLLQRPSLVNLVQQVYEQPGSIGCVEADGIRLRLHQQDLLSLELPVGHFDIVYLDAFSPDHNPECWTATQLQRYYHALVPGGTLSTYCVRGSVRRALTQAGFIVEKQPGPPGKREILLASRPA